MSVKVKPGLLVWITVPYLVVLAIALSGVLDALVPDGVVSTWSAALSVFLYWLCTYTILRVVLSWRAKWRVIILAVVALVLALVIGELAVRVFHPGRAQLEFRLWYSPQYHHVLPANYQMYHGVDVDTGDPIFVRTNEDGFRTDYTREAFLDHETRIAVLGDSFAFGMFNREEAAYPQAVERALRTTLGREDIAVLNAGVISHSPFIHKLVLKTIIKEYHPTVVILLLDATDIGDDHEYMRVVASGNNGPYFPRTPILTALGTGAELGDYSALYQRLYLPIKAIPLFLFHPIAIAGSASNPLILHGVTIDGEVQPTRFMIYKHPLQKTRQFFENTYANIADTAAYSASIGAEFVLVVSPRYHHWNPEECPSNWESFAYSNNEPYQFEYFRFFEEKRQEADFKIFSLLAAFKNAAGSPLCFQHDPHWNARGHQVAAEATAAYIISKFDSLKIIQR